MVISIEYKVTPFSANCKIIKGAAAVPREHGEGYDAILCPVGNLYLSAADGNALKGDAYLPYGLEGRIIINYLVISCFHPRLPQTEQYIGHSGPAAPR